MQADDGVPKKREDDCELLSANTQTTLSNIEKKLFNAVTRDQADEVRRIIEHYNVNVDVQNNYGRTPLLVAAARGNVEIVALLHNCGAKVEIADKFGMTPLLWAAEKNHRAVAEELINNADAEVLRRSKQGAGIVHICARTGADVVLSERNSKQDVFAALRKIADSRAIIELAVTRSKHLPLDDRDYNGKTPFLLAAERNNIEVMDYLAKNRVTITCKDNEDMNALHLATKNRKLDAVKACMLFPALKNLLSDTDKEGNTPLIYAVINNDIKIAKELLINRANPNEFNDKGETPLMEAAKHNSEEMIQLLINEGAALEKIDKNGNTALHYAAFFNMQHSCRKLLQLHAKIEAKNNRRQTPLHVAVEQNSVESTDILLLAGAKLSEMDRNRKTPLSLASRGCYAQIVCMLIKAARLRKYNPELAAELKTELLTANIEATPKLVSKLDLDDDLDDMYQSSEASFAASQVYSIRTEDDPREDEKLQQNDENQSEIGSRISESIKDSYKYAGSILSSIGQKLSSSGYAIGDKISSFAADFDDGESGREKQKMDPSDRSTEITQLSEGTRTSLSNESTLRGTSSAITMGVQDVPALIINSLKMQLISFEQFSLANQISLWTSNAPRRTRSDDENDVYSDVRTLLHSSEMNATDESDSDVTETHSVDPNAASAACENDTSETQLETSDQASNLEPPVTKPTVRIDESAMSTPGVEGIQREATFQSTVVTDLKPLLVTPPDDSSSFLIERSFTMQPTSEEPKKYSFLVDQQPYSEAFTKVFFELSHELLHRNDWEKLAQYWEFEPDQQAALEFDSFNPKAYKNQGFLVLQIWFHGLKEDQNPTLELAAALNAIGLPKVAKKLFKKVRTMHENELLN